MAKTEINAHDLVIDYTVNKMGLIPLCAKYHIGKLKAKAVLEKNGIPLKKKGKQPLNEDFIIKDYKQRKYAEHDGYHYEAVDQHANFRTRDYMNAGGFLTSHIKKQYGIEIPTLYDRRLYYMRTGNYWWEQWFTIVEVKDREVKKCPYCDWETTDLENKSGVFEQHLRSIHNMSKMEYITEHPSEKPYFALVNPRLNRQMETDETKFIICQVCGQKMARISSEHLSKHGLTKKEYMDKFGVTETLSQDYKQRLSDSMKVTNENMTHSFSSAQEQEIKNFVSSLGFECETNRKILHGKELDIYIPSKGVAIEFNGNIWHSEKYGKNCKYHLWKLEECNKQGVKLIQIFEDEYALHKDIVFSKIKHILGCDCNAKKIGARKCQIEGIKMKEAEAFLNSNHIQGFSSSTSYLGLKYNNELIAVMTFLNENDGCWELNRFATKNGTICQGASGKLFTYFVKNFHPKEVKSFADRRWTLDGNNNMYTKIGFKLEGVLAPEYRYYNPHVDKYKRFHKFGFRKQILHKKYGLPLTMTELEMTKALGYDRIWDCGLFKYVWRAEDDEA